MIYKYLLEIKYRFFFSCLAWTFVMINCYCFKETLLYLFMKLSLTSNNNVLFYFLTTDVAEIFIAYLQLSYFIANQLVTIFIYWQFFVFLSAGLHLFEYRYFKIIIFITTLGWLLCVFVISNYIFPASWSFFLKFQEHLSFQNITLYFEIKLNEYLKFYKSVYCLCILIYQMIVLFLIFLDLFKTNLCIVKKFKKVFYYFFFIVSTLLTPPEVIYQLITSICLITTYELIIIYIIFQSELIIFR